MLFFLNSGLQCGKRRRAPKGAWSRSAFGVLWSRGLRPRPCSPEDTHAGWGRRWTPNQQNPILRKQGRGGWWCQAPSHSRGIFLSDSPSSLSGLFFGDFMFVLFYVQFQVMWAQADVKGGLGPRWGLQQEPLWVRGGVLAEASVGLDNRRVSQDGNTGKPQCEFCIKEKPCLWPENGGLLPPEPARHWLLSRGSWGGSQWSTQEARPTSQGSGAWAPVSSPPGGWTPEAAAWRAGSPHTGAGPVLQALCCSSSFLSTRFPPRPGRPLSPCPTPFTARTPASLWCQGP